MAVSMQVVSSEREDEHSRSGDHHRTHRQRWPAEGCRVPPISAQQIPPPPRHSASETPAWVASDVVAEVCMLAQNRRGAYLECFRTESARGCRQNVAPDT
jgi:hypothetical protein